LPIWSATSLLDAPKQAHDSRELYFWTRQDSARHLCGSTFRHLLLQFRSDGMLQRVAETSYDVEWSAFDNKHMLIPCDNKYSCCAASTFMAPLDAPRWFTQYTVWQIVRGAKDEVTAVTHARAKYEQVLVHETNRSNYFDRVSYTATY